MSRWCAGNVDAALRESAVALDLWDHRQGFYDVRMGPYLQRIRADVLAAAGMRDEAQRLEDAAWAASEKFDAPESPTRPAPPVSAVALSGARVGATGFRAWRFDAALPGSSYAARPSGMRTSLSPPSRCTGTG